MGVVSVTINSTMQGVWRKAQGELVDALNFKCEETSWLGEIPGLKLAASLREMTFPVRLRISGGIASIGEGGNEARPSSVGVTDATVAFVHKNGRFTVSKLAHWASISDPAPEIEKQITVQGMDKVDSLCANVSDAFWGFSTGIRAQTSTNATQSSGTYTLKNAFGLTSIAGTTAAQKAYLANLFQVGEGVALVRSGALVSNGYGIITARSTTNGTIAVTWAGSTDSNDGDNLVLYNAILDGDTFDLNAHTDYNKDLVGILEMMTGTSVHGIDGSSVEGWSPAYTDVSGGRYTGSRHRAALQAIGNFGGGTPASIKTIVSQGVERDVIANYQAGVRYDSPMAMEIDGDVKARGKRLETSRRVPPGFVFMFDPAALGKKTLLPFPTSAPTWPDGKELINQSGMIFTLDYPLVLAVRIRKRLAYFANLQEA